MEEDYAYEAILGGKEEESVSVARSCGHLCGVSSSIRDVCCWCSGARLQCQTCREGGNHQHSVQSHRTYCRKHEIPVGCDQYGECCLCKCNEVERKERRARPQPPIPVVLKKSSESVNLVQTKRLKKNWGVVAQRPLPTTLKKKKRATVYVCRTIDELVDETNEPDDGLCECDDVDEEESSPSAASTTSTISETGKMGSVGSFVYDSAAWPSLSSPVATDNKSMALDEWVMLQHDVEEKCFDNSDRFSESSWVSVSEKSLATSFANMVQKNLDAAQVESLENRRNMFLKKMMQQRKAALDFYAKKKEERREGEDKDVGRLWFKEHSWEKDSHSKNSRRGNILTSARLYSYGGKYGQNPPLSKQIKRKKYKCK